MSNKHTKHGWYLVSEFDKKAFALCVDEGCDATLAHAEIERYVHSLRNSPETPPPLDVHALYSDLCQVRDLYEDGSLEIGDEKFSVIVRKLGIHCKNNPKVKR